ncbi:MAG: ThaI family type II restriction endonuclease [Candidatus Hydrogenedens sp.]
MPLSVQRMIFDEMGRKNYIKLPKPGTNPRGVELSKEALSKLLYHKQTKKIEIHWQKIAIKYNSYKRWIDMWKEE